MAIKIAEQTVAKPAKSKPRAPQAPKSRSEILDQAAKQAVAPALSIGKRMAAVASSALKSARGRPASGKRVVTLRLDPDVLDLLQANGPGWGARANAMLRKGLKL